MNIYMKKRKRQKREKEEKRKRGKEQTQHRGMGRTQNAPALSAPLMYLLVEYHAVSDV